MSTASRAIYAALAKPRPHPVSLALDTLNRPVNAKLIFAVIVLLSFVPLTLGFDYLNLQHNVAQRITQSSTQILLIGLSLLIFAIGYVKLSWNTGCAAVLCVCIAVLQILAVTHNQADPKNYVMPLAFPFFLLAGCVAYSLANRLDIQTRGKYVAKIVDALLVFFCLECVTRYAFSPFVRTALYAAYNDLPSGTVDWIYRYKMSVFFSDSNYTGLALLCLTAIMLSFRNSIRTRKVFLGYALIVATLSRAAILAAACQFLIYKLWRRRKFILATLVVTCPIAVFCLLRIYMSAGPEAFREIDPSLASKFLILQGMIGLFSNADIVQRLAGIGSGNTQGLLGIAAHDVIAVLALELGLLGSLLIAAYVWLLSKGSSRAVYLLLVPVLIAGFAAIDTSIPYFYIALGLLGAIKDQQ